MDGNNWAYGFEFAQSPALPHYRVLRGLIAANVVSGKIITLGDLVVPAGVLASSHAFAMTDTLCEF